MERLKIHLFNGFSIAYGDVPLTSLDLPRLQALVAFLVLNRGTPQFRYFIANQFWPDSPEDQARTNLRNLIYKLRQALPQPETFLSIEKQTLAWHVDAPYELDVEVFEQAFSEKVGQAPTLDNLERAADVYLGDLLPACYDEWIIPIRVRLRQAYINALESAAVLNEDRRSYERALTYARRWVQADPLDEKANFHLMRLHVLMDNRAAAIQVYKVFSDHIQSELGVEPGLEIQELHRNLQKPAAAAATNWHRGGGELPLVGRQVEWQKIQSNWKMASTGNPHLLLLTGEAGIGKTRLAEVLMRWAARQGICTASAQAFPAEGNLPYAPVVTWLRAHPLPKLESVWLTEIARLLPEILQDQPEVPPPGRVSEAWQRQRLFEALSRAILGNCQKRLLLLDDMQWCDRDTLEWLHYLLRQDPHACLLIIGTVRSEELAGGRSHPLAALQTALRQMGACSEIVLGPLSESETAQLATQVSGEIFSSDELSALYYETEGSPLFVVETIRAGLKKKEALPGKIQAVLSTRIEQLSPATRGLVSVAATIGRRFPFEVLHQVAGLSDDALARGIDELLEKRIIREYNSTNAGLVSQIEYDFSHDKLREAAFAGLSMAHRRLIHRQVAEALRELAGGALEDYAAEIASHYDRAGVLAQAVVFYQAAGERARKIFANQDAIRYFVRALEMAEGLSIGSQAATLGPEARANLLEQYGDVLHLTGNFLEAQIAFEASLQQPVTQSPARQASILRRISDFQVSLYDHPSAFATLELAERTLGLTIKKLTTSPGVLSEEHREWIKVQFAKIQWLYWQNRLEEMDRLIGQIRPWIESADLADLQFELLGFIYQAELRREQYRLSDQTVEIARQKRDLTFDSKTPIAACTAEFQYGFGLLWNGRTGDACQILENALIQSEKLVDCQSCFDM